MEGGEQYGETEIQSNVMTVLLGFVEYLRVVLMTSGLLDFGEQTQKF